MDTLLQSARGLHDAAPHKLIEWTLTHFPQRTALSVSFGGGGVVLAHMLSEIAPDTPVIFLNTGFHFPETLAFRDQLVEKYRLNLVEMQPLHDPGPLYQTDTDACCGVRKVEPMQRALNNYDAWISALRRDQSQTRAALDVAEWQERDNGRVLKVYPLVAWNRQQVWRYLHDHKVPYHPLLDQGYTSIGCWPCTRATREGEDERAGRWEGTGKTECGLHTFTKRADT